MTENTTVETIRARRAAAARGPWHWSGNTDTRQLRLSNWIPGAGRCTVMDFTRWGMQSAGPRFIDENLFMVDGDTLVTYEVAPAATRRDDPRVYRADVVDIRHPDAQLIAHAPQDIDDLLHEIDKLTAVVEERDAAVRLLAEARRDLHSFADRMDEFVYDELACHLDDGIYDVDGNDLVAAVQLEGSDA